MNVANADYGRETAYQYKEGGAILADCGDATRACYYVRPRNGATVPALTAMKFQILGTVNQVSASTAGDFYVSTHVSYAGANGPFYDINQGKFASGFVTVPGSIAPTKAMIATDATGNAKHVTWASDTYYTMFVTLDYRVPKDGAFKIICPSEINVEALPSTMEMKRVGGAALKIKGVTLKVNA
jgi:hypothetical protein